MTVRSTMLMFLLAGGCGTGVYSDPIWRQPLDPQPEQCTAMEGPLHPYTQKALFLDQLMSESGCTAPGRPC